MGYCRSGAPGRRARARRAQTARRRQCACRRALLGTRSSPERLLGTRAHGRVRTLTLARAHTSTHASAHRHARARVHEARASERARARMRRERTKYRQRLGLLKPPRERQDRGLHSAARPRDGPNGTLFFPCPTGCSSRRFAYCAHPDRPCSGDAMRCGAVPCPRARVREWHRPPAPAAAPTEGLRP